MMIQDNMINIFLSNPTEALYSLIEDKKMALRLLKELPDSASKLLFLYSVKDKDVSKIDIVRHAVKEGNTDIFLKVMEMMEDKKYNKVLKNLTNYCAELGREKELDIILIERGISNLDGIVLNATIAGHLDIILNMIRRGYNDYKHIALIALESGHDDIVDLMVKDYSVKISSDERLKASAGRGDLDLSIVKADVGELSHLAYCAAESGHFALVKTLIEGIRDKNGNIVCADDLEYIMEGAAEEGHLDIFNLMVEMGAVDAENTAYIAAANGHLNIVKGTFELDIEFYPDHFIAIARNAIENGHFDILKLVIDKLEISDFNDLVGIAAKHGYRKIVQFLLAIKMKRQLKLEMDKLCKIHPID